MSYEIQAASSKEGKLFYRLDGEAAKRHGAIGYMRADFGRDGKDFFSTWFNNQKHLKTPAFKAGFDSLIHYLREGTEYPPFRSRRDMRIFARGHSDWQIADHVIGFKAKTADYAYYARCAPFSDDYDIYVFAYDNRWLLPELAGKHELPNDCFGVSPSSGELVFIVMGEQGYFPQGQSTDDPITNRQIATAKNVLLGVTRAQEAAMLAGSLHGWDAPAAKPWNYDNQGDFRKAPPKKKEPER